MTRSVEFSKLVGCRSYGSGYPGVTGTRGVDGYGFPFYFWPVVWGGAAGASGGAYLHTSEVRSHSSSRQLILTSIYLLSTAHPITAVDREAS